MTVQPWLMVADASLLARLDPSLPGGLPDRVVVDWERRRPTSDLLGGAAALDGPDSADDLRRVCRTVDVAVVCRVNPAGPDLEAEIGRAIDAGASEVLVPMVRSVDDGHQVLEAAAGRVRVGLMIETTDAVEEADDLAALGVDYLYVGLLDLAVERGTPSVFTALVDGTVEDVMAAAGSTPVGFGGLTVPGGGHPVPSALLVGELVRSGASFAFLRRSFVADLGDREPSPALVDIRGAVALAAQRTAAEIAHDRAELVALVERIDRASSP